MDDVELKTLFTAIGDQSIQILECIFFFFRFSDVKGQEKQIQT